MFRRSILMAMIGLALAASPALANCQWHSQMKLGTATASRTVGKGCSVRAGYHWGSLLVTCSPKHHATLTYLFSGTHNVYGHARVGVDAWGSAKLTRVVKASSSSIQVTVTVSGPGTTQVDSVSVGYYAH